MIDEYGMRISRSVLAVRQRARADYSTDRQRAATVDTHYVGDNAR